MINITSYNYQGPNFTRKNSNNEMLAVFLETSGRQFVGYPTGRFRNLEFTNNRKKLPEKFYWKQRKCARELSLGYHTLRS